MKIAHEIPYFDKWVHFLMYAGLCTLLWSEFFRAHALPYPLKRGWIGACALPIIFSALIEIGQSLTLYRSGDVMDFLCNSLGAICAGCVATYIYNPFYKRI
ncbi:MAG: VanZ family protein [Prevotellaceae bacterium]|nr:VanZ family protein [Prevotellaceae bacterium]